MAITEAGRRELFARRFAEEAVVTVDETVGGVALAVLAILALDQLAPDILLSIATVVAGLALGLMSAKMSANFSEALRGSDNSESAVAGGGMNAGVFAGVAGVILGVLAILDVARPELIAVALIVFGAAVVLDFIVKAQLRSLHTRYLGMTGSEQAERSVAPAMSAGMNLGSAGTAAGVAIITLGILALTGIHTPTLVAVGLLTLGAYLFLEASSSIGRMLPSLAAE